MTRRSRAARSAVALAALLGVASACTAGGSPSAGPSTGGTSAPPSTSPSSSPPSPTGSPPMPTCPQRVFARMTEAQRVGQLFVVGLAQNRLGPAEIAGIRAHHFGSVSFIVTTSAGRDAVRAVTNAAQAQATTQATAGVRFYVAANQEGGLIQALRGSGFSRIPTAVTQGTFPASALQQDAFRWGQELRAAGVNFNFAPVMDVVPPGTVSAHGVAFLRGMQQAHVATSAKHFPGLGRVKGNTDFAAQVVDRVTTSDDPYLQPFERAIQAGVPFVMVALATYTRIDPNHLAVFSPVVMRLLRTGLGFKGVIVSDDIGEAKAIASIPPGVRAIDFLQAGGDMIVSKFVGPADAMAPAVLSRMGTDPAFRRRVDDAVLRILEAKGTSGLLPCAGG